MNHSLTQAVFESGHSEFILGQVLSSSNDVMSFGQIH